MLITVSIVIIAVGLNVYKSSPVKQSGQTTSIGKSNKSPTLQSSFDKKKYSISDPASIWIVVNKSRPLSPIDYSPKDLTGVGNGQLMRKEAAGAFVQLISAANVDGLKIGPWSGYRSYGIQVGVYNNEVKKNGQAVADSQSAKAGYSEHQTGFAIDVSKGSCSEDCFGNTKESKWLSAHAYEYGFIIRYTTDKQAITGYRYEPWHIRYIGTELSNELHKQDITTLEEFFNL